MIFLGTFTFFVLRKRIRIKESKAYIEQLKSRPVVKEEVSSKINDKQEIFDKLGIKKKV